MSGGGGSANPTPDSYPLPSRHVPSTPPLPPPSPPPGVDIFYWVVFSFATQSVTILPHRLHCTVTASLDAANAHITHFSSHDSGIRVFFTEITLLALNY